MNILVLNGNTEHESLTAAICTAYSKGAVAAGHKVTTIHIGELHYDPVLHEGLHATQPLETDLLDFQQQLTAADHFVIVYPTWWGGMPALLKGLFDRSFHSGYAYRYHDKDPLWDKLLKGKSAHIITTMDSPLLWYMLAYRSAGTFMLRNAILKFCGFGPVRTTYVTRVKYRKPNEIAGVLERITAKAQKL